MSIRSRMSSSQPAKVASPSSMAAAPASTSTCSEVMRRASLELRESADASDDPLLKLSSVGPVVRASTTDLGGMRRAAMVAACSDREGDNKGASSLPPPRDLEEEEPTDPSEGAP